MGRRADAGRLVNAEDLTLPLVSLIGRPNVGKSSLFNRLVGGRPALVEDVPGVTRDRRYGVCNWLGVRFRVVDTGGLDPSAEGILGAMRTQTLRAVDEGQVMVFVVDVKEGLTPVDEDVARLLRRTGKPVLVAANKVDSDGRQAGMGEVYALGFPEVFPISASHGRGTGDLLDAVIALVRDLTGSRPGDEEEEDDDDESGDEESPPVELGDTPITGIRIAFVGKPNVGKSSMVNRLLGEERVLVHDQPGTTRDPIDTPFRVGERDFVLVDTAGLRRRRAVDTLTEAVAGKMARDQLARADVAALVIDAQSGATAEDARLASLIEESGRAALIVMNKADLIPRAELDRRRDATREVLQFISWAPLLVTSAVTGRGVVEIPEEAARVYGEWSRRVPTSDLNKHFEDMVARRPPPSGMNGRHVRLYYATQAGVRPPTFYISSNHADDIGAPYRRYLVNQFREIYGFEGAPLRVVIRGHGKKGVKGQKT
jgi:GTP-binding protein